MTFYKAVRPDYTDFKTGTIHYRVGSTVTHPAPGRDHARGYLSVSVSPTDCTGMEWPCRLLVVEPVDEWTPEPDDLPSKRACHSLRVVSEVPAHLALGPQGVHVAALIDRASRLTRDEAERLSAARDAAWDAARGAALALTVRDLIPPHHYTTLTAPWAAVIGPAHPHDTKEEA